MKMKKKKEKEKKKKKKKRKKEKKKKDGRLGFESDLKDQASWVIGIAEK